ncbi:MAG: hypothetical protein JW878_05300 [Methanomicrobia archaeon]|nr:hypothetical protein [Methanomicrobia archaeon]
MKIERSTLLKLYYVCLIVIVIAGLAVHFMEAAEPEGAAVANGHGEVVEEAATHNGGHGEAAEEGGEEVGHFWWLDIPLFAAGFAFVSGVILLAFSKLGVYPLLKRDEDYYEQHSFGKAEEEEGGEQ